MAENQRILDEWQKAFEKNGGNADNFSWDGILFKGEVYREGGSDNWVRKESDNDTVENELWDNAPIRILFLTKDQNVGYGGAWDSRINSFREKNSDKEDPVLSKYHNSFGKRMAYIAYGLANTTDDKDVALNFIQSHESDVVKFLDSFPLAHINCKKEGGSASCPDELFQNALKEYEKFLEQQIENVDADIFVCCGSTQAGYHIDKANYSLDFLQNHGYNFEYLGSKYSDLYYDAKRNKLAIDSYHLSYTGVSDQELYDQDVETYHKFLIDHPEFLISHRNK